MSLLAKWDVGTYNATAVVGVTSVEDQWAALMAYLTTSGILYVAVFTTPTEPGLYCYQRPDSSYCVMQAVETPDWPYPEPPPIFITEIASLSWILVPA